MVRQHTNVSNVEAKLKKSEGSFTKNTTPSLSQLDTWIDEVTNVLDEVTNYKYQELQREDIIGWHGESFLLTESAPISNLSVYYNNNNTEFEEPSWELLSEYNDYVVDLQKGKITPKFKSRRSLTHMLNKFKLEYTSGSIETPKWLQSLATDMVVLKVLESSIGGRGEDDEAGQDVRVGQVRVVKPAEFGVNNYSSLKVEVNRRLEELKNSTGVIRYVNY